MMKVIWAPWRMEYVTSEINEQECIFCPGEDRSKDEERFILSIDGLSVILLNKFPYINGHLLIAPKRHVSTLDVLSTKEKVDLITKVEKSIDVLRKLLHPEGFNVGLNLGKIAGAGVEDHLHFHVVPRWTGDTNYMTVFGEVRVVPEHIQKTYQKLLPFFKNFSVQDNIL
ncbi:MAG: HIT family protein [Thermodesulfobacteriota bacterium]